MKCGFRVDRNLVEQLESKVTREREPRSFKHFRRVARQRGLDIDVNDVNEAALLFIRMAKWIW